MVAHRTRLTSENVDEILRGYDVVVDGTDNFPTRYLVNDACVRLGPAGGLGVGAAVRRADDRVLGTRPACSCATCSPTPPRDDEVPSCAEAGVLGALCGQVGSVMATEVVKLVTGTGEPLLGRVLVVDALRGRWTEVPLVGRPTRSRHARRSLPMSDVPVVTAPELVRRLAAREAGTDDFLLIDVREPAEYAPGVHPRRGARAAGVGARRHRAGRPAARPGDRRALPGGRAGR